MSELGTIVAGYRRATARGEQVALATLTQTEGSTYRKAGARALITSKRVVGMLSGGCVEPELLDRARCLRIGESLTIAHDFRGPDAALFGFPLGCKGALRIVLEAIDAHDPHNPIELLDRHSRATTPGAVAHAYSSDSIQRLWLVNGESFPQGSLPPTTFQTMHQACVAAVNNEDNVGSPSLFAKNMVVERLPTPIALTIIGAGPDVPALAWWAKRLGWRVAIIDHREAFLQRAELAKFNRDFVSLDRLAHHLETITTQAAMVMTHDLRADTEAVRGLMNSRHRFAYLGVLGPRERTLSICENLRTDIANLCAPAGLDLGGTGCEAVALSIVAQIQANIHGRTAMPLTNKKGAIHEATHLCDAWNDNLGYRSCDTSKSRG
jgi:xanthine dehydrogenase accessory factor